jgi:hypothetical protein
MTTNDPASVDANEWLMGSSVRSFSWKDAKKGAHVVGFISRIPEVRQQSEVTTGDPMFWKDGRPRLQVRVILQTEERDPEDDEDTGERAVYIRSNMQKAVAQAIRSAGERGLEVGARLWIEYVGDEKPTQKGFNGAKLFTAKYTAPEALAVEVDPEQVPF